MTPLPAFRTRPRLRSEDGFIIVEVLVSAVILLTVSLAVFLTLSNADKVAGNQQKRALAANFAQSELERIRSLPVEDVAASRGTRTVTVKGITYNVNVVAKWVSDGSDEPQCSTRSGGLDYLRTTVTVSWPDMGKAKAVKLTSFYTPPAGAGGGDTGSVSVQITDRNGGPVSNVGVTLDGPTDFNEVTNVNGCVVFGFVPAMPTGYKIKFSRAGYVDGGSNPNIEDEVAVTAGETNKLQYDFDRGGFTKVTFRTRARGVELPTKPERVQFFNAAQPSGTPKTFAINQASDEWDGSSIPLFPFTSPYAVYAGNCKANAVPGTNPNAKFVNITPNVFQNTGVVYLPAIDVTVRYGTPGAPGAVVNKAMVMYDPAGCTPLYRRYTKEDGTGQLEDPGFPYAATGLICAAGPGANGRRIVRNQANVNFGVNGTQITLFLNDTGNKPNGWTSTNDSCFT